MAENKSSIFINKTYDPLLFRTIIRRFWWWIPLLISICFVIATLYLRYTKPIYESELLLQIENEDNAKNVIDIENINSKKDIFYSDIELLKSELLFSQVLHSLGLDVSIFYKGKILTEEKYRSGNLNIVPYHLADSSLCDIPITLEYNSGKIELQYYLDKEYNISGNIGEHIKNDHFDIVVKIERLEQFKDEAASNEIFFTFNSSQNLIDRFIGNLGIFPLDERARTVLINFRGDNPRICHDMTLAVANTFINYSTRQKKQSSESILRFIDLQLDSLSNELKRSKDSLMNFQRAVNIGDPEKEGDNVQSDVSKFQDELFDLEDEISTLQAIHKKLMDNPNRLDVYRILPELMGKSYESAIAGHIESLHTLLEEKDEILFRLTPESSEIKRIEKKIQEKSKQVIRSIEAIEGRLNIRRKVLSTKVGQLESEYASLPGKRMEYNRLKNIQDLNEKYFQLLTEKKVQYSISDAGFSSQDRILKRPSLNTDPVEPKVNTVYAVFILLGFFMSIGVLFYKYVSFNEISLLEDLQTILPSKATILGGVPLSKFALEYSQIMVTKAPKSMMSEALRKIRVNLNYIHPDYKTIAISSSISGEGKTFVALNLAGIISMTGKKTIILDLDMRKPKIHLAFNLDNEKGMSNLIIGKVPLDQAIVKNVETNLDIITSGPIPPNPSELLLSKRFKEIIEELKTTYDVVIIDNPPIGLVSDGIQVLSEADIPIYVFKSQYSKRNFAQRIKELFEMKQLTSLNVILNGIAYTKHSIYGYGYWYGYGYGDYGGYVDDIKSSDLKLKKKKNKFIDKLQKKTLSNGDL
ncbi:MAG: polysaccharide biosynthesis tyrosine autokinase [Crocinitomicaceae bacterium]|nr:polysaccharide biosynthesis tyrosine autokinase [Crocinitomicaceae bacterium]